MTNQQEYATGNKSHVVVRRATFDDVNWIIPELKKFSNFFESKHQLFSDDEFVGDYIEDKIENHVVLVAEINNEPAGFMSAFKMPHPYNPSIRLLSESAWWVIEEYRGTRAGHMLFKEMVDIGKRECDWILMTIEDKSPVSDGYFLKQGFRFKEKSFLMEVT